MKKTIYLMLGILVIIFITSCTANGHNCMSFQSEWQDITPFMCGENGSQQIVCLKCNKVLDTRQITKEHNYYENIIKEVTCTEDGLVENICQYCGDSHTITQTKYGHSYTEEKISDATCTKGEMVLKTCERCNYSYEAEVSFTSKGHDYEDIILQEVTCTRAYCNNFSHLGFFLVLGKEQDSALSLFFRLDSLNYHAVKQRFNSHKIYLQVFNKRFFHFYAQLFKQ